MFYNTSSSKWQWMSTTDPWLNMVWLCQSNFSNTRMLCHCLVLLIDLDISLLLLISQDFWNLSVMMNTVICMRTLSVTQISNWSLGMTSIIMNVIHNTQSLHYWAMCWHGFNVIGASPRRLTTGGKRRHLHPGPLGPWSPFCAARQPSDCWKGRQ